jgi:hypothetical protein
MFQDLNRDWMDEYEFTYQKYKSEWDYHYQEVKKFLLSCIHEKIRTLGFIGVTSNIPELDSDILSYVDKIILLDIYEEGMIKAKEFLKTELSFPNVETKVFDITLGFVDQIVKYFQEYKEEKLNEEQLFSKLKNPAFKYEEYSGKKYDFLIHMGLMDYYMMPLFVQHCKTFIQMNSEFFELMKHLNDIAVRVSLSAMFSMLSDAGHLVISSPVNRAPEGKKCSRSLFWVKSLEKHIEDSGFVIEKKSKHIWEEFPEKDGHSHEILNVHCRKKLS